MISGELEFVATGCPELFRAKRSGFELRVVGEFCAGECLFDCLPQGDHRPQTAQSKRVGVNQFLDTSHVSARLALRHVGVDPDSVTFIQVGSTPERFAALRAGCRLAPMSCLRPSASIPRSQSLDLVSLHVSSDDMDPEEFRRILGVR
jgi:ABC-type taurine transport system substrate-binding protein